MKSYLKIEIDTDTDALEIRCGGIEKFLVVGLAEAMDKETHILKMVIEALHLVCMNRNIDIHELLEVKDQKPLQT